MSTALKNDIATTPITTATLNVRAAMALILTYAINVRLVSVIDPRHPEMRRHIVVAGDSFDRIAERQGSTPADVAASNPGVNPTRLRIGQTVNYHRASMQPQIVRWEAVTVAFLTRGYNGGGDSSYGEKLNYVLGIMP